LSTVVSVGWIVSRTGASDIITAAAFGCFLTALWRSSAFMGGWILSQAHDAGALDMEMTTCSSLSIIIFGRLTAVVAVYGATAVLAAAVVLLLGHGALEVGSPLLLLLSIPVAGLAIVACAYILIPMSFLTGGLPGFFNAILPGVVIVSGFLQPTDLLPGPVKFIGGLFGTTWAMDAIRHAIPREPDIGTVATSLLLSLVLSISFLVVARMLIGIAEQRLREGRYSSFNQR
jgi:hypothetical protein